MDHEPTSGVPVRATYFRHDDLPSRLLVWWKVWLRSRRTRVARFVPSPIFVLDRRGYFY